jgi:hypothetical protein
MKEDSVTENNSHLNFNDHTMNNHSSNAWIELFVIGKLPNRRAYHVSFYWNNAYSFNYFS